MNRIDGVNPLAAGAVRGAQSHAAGAVDGATDGREHDGTAGAAQAGGDRASVSSHGKIVSMAVRAAESAPDLRSERVAALKAAISDGTYRSDERLIARRLFAAGLLDE